MNGNGEPPALAPDAILRMLQSRAESRAWDSPPVIWAIVSRDGRPALQEVRIPRGNREPGLSPGLVRDARMADIPVPDWVMPLGGVRANRVMWTADEEDRSHPAAVLDALAEELRGRAGRGQPFLPGVGPVTVHGIAARFEGWGLVDGWTDHAVIRQAAHGEWNRISDHPDRVETRIVVAIDRAGNRYEAATARGPQPPHSAVTPAGSAPESMFLGGRILDGISRLMAALAEVEQGRGRGNWQGMRRKVSRNGVNFRMTPSRRAILAAVVDAPGPVDVQAVCRRVRLGPAAVSPALELLVRSALIHDGLHGPESGLRSSGNRGSLYRPLYDRWWYRDCGLLPPEAGVAPEAGA